MSSQLSPLIKAIFFNKRPSFKPTSSTQYFNNTRSTTYSKLLLEFLGQLSVLDTNMSFVDVTSHNTHVTHADLVLSHTPTTSTQLLDILGHRTHQVLALFSFIV